MLTEFRLHEKRENRRLRRLAIKDGARKHKNVGVRCRSGAFTEYAKARMKQTLDSMRGSMQVKDTGFLTKMIGGIQNMIGMHR